jgi:hypothetical protein
LQVVVRMKIGFHGLVLRVQIREGGNSNPLRQGFQLEVYQGVACHAWNSSTAYPSWVVLRRSFWTKYLGLGAKGTDFTKLSRISLRKMTGFRLKPGIPLLSRHALEISWLAAHLETSMGQDWPDLHRRCPRFG